VKKGMDNKVAINSLWDTEAPHFQRIRKDKTLTDTDLRAMQAALEKRVKSEHEILAAMATHPHVVRFVGVSFYNHPLDVKLHRTFILTELVEGKGSLQGFYKGKGNLYDALLVSIIPILPVANFNSGSYNDGNSRCHAIHAF